MKWGAHWGKQEVVAVSNYLSWSERLRIPRVVERSANGDLEVRHATMGRVQIDLSACTGCELCVRVCPAKSLEMTEDHAARMIGDGVGCIACGDCVAVCRPNAVQISRPMTYDGLYKHIGRGPLEAPRCF